MAPVSGLEMASPSNAAPDTHFKVIAGEREYPLHEGLNIIGRCETAEVRITSDRASRQHAQITISKGHSVIEDLDSKNGTFVQGERLMAPAELRHGDEIQIGRRLTVLRFIVDDGKTLTEETSKED